MSKQKEAVGLRYRELLGNIDIRAHEVKKFLNFLNRKTDWTAAPVSRRTKMTLFEHSVNVTEVLIKMSDGLSSGISKESLTIVGLFHDISKLGAFVGDEFYPRFLEVKNGLVYNEQLAEIALGVRSLYMISRFVPLNEEEVQAIISSEGMFNSVNEYLKYKETSLALLLRWSDYWCSHVIEKGDRFSYDKRVWKEGLK